MGVPPHPIADPRYRRARGRETLIAAHNRGSLAAKDAVLASERIVTVPAGFEMHPKLKGILGARRDNVVGRKPKR